MSADNYGVSVQEFIDMARSAALEIKCLKRRVERLEPKAEAYDLLKSTIDAMAPRSYVLGLGDNLADTLNKRVEELLMKMRYEEKKAKENANAPERNDAAGFQSDGQQAGGGDQVPHREDHGLHP